METETPTPPVAQNPGVLKRLFSPLWWQHAAAFSWHFRHQLLWPAIFFMIFGLITAAVLDSFEGMRGLQNQTVEAGPFIAKMFIIVVGLSAGAVFFLLGMFSGVLKLTAYTRAFLSCPLPSSAATLAQSTYREQAKACQSEAVAAMSHHKAYLAKALFLAGLAMLPGLFIVGVCSFAGILLSAPDMPGLPIPPEARSLALPCQIAVVAVLVMLNNYSVVTIAVTSMTNRTIGDATRKSLLLTLTSAPLLTLASIIVVVITTVITTPQELLSMLHPTGHLTPGPLPVAMAWEVWQVLSSVMVFPICTALLTEVVRDPILADVPKDTAVAAVASGSAEDRSNGEQNDRPAEDGSNEIAKSNDQGNDAD